MIGITSFNVHDWKETNDIRKGSEKIASFIYNQGDDVCCLQESYERKANDGLYLIPEEVTKNYTYSFSYPEKGLKILSKTPIENAEKKAFDSYSDKGVIYAEINNKHIFNVHLDDKEEHVRLYQTSILLKFVKEMTEDSSSKKIYICGDFNSLNETEYSKEKWDEMLTKEKDYTSPNSLVYNKITNSYMDTRRGLEDPSTSIHGRRVDYIFTNQRVKETFKITQDYTLSDHAMISYKF